MVCPPPPGNQDDDRDDSEKTSILQEDQASLVKELAKAKEQEACLIIIRGTPQGQRYFLTQEEMIIGRDTSADISLADSSISRKHAKIRKSKDGKVVIEDLGSSNGTAINDKKIQPGIQATLAKEDMVRMGNWILKYLPAGELEILFYGNLGSAAHTDPLTRTYNRRYFLEALDAEFKRAKALHTDFAVMYFDLDHFKKVNDTHGHDAGDYVLKEFANLVRAGYLRPKDVFARFGGEEFVVLLANTSASKAVELAEKVRAAVETHAFVYDGKRIPITASMGVAELRADIESPQTLLKMADKALYAAKSGGRNRVVTAS